MKGNRLSEGHVFSRFPRYMSLDAHIIRIKRDQGLTSFRAEHKNVQSLVCLSEFDKKAEKCEFSGRKSASWIFEIRGSREVSKTPSKLPVCCDPVVFLNSTYKCGRDNPSILTTPKENVSSRTMEAMTNSENRSDSRHYASCMALFRPWNGDAESNAFFHECCSAAVSLSEKHAVSSRVHRDAYCQALQDVELDHVNRTSPHMYDTAAPEQDPVPLTSICSTFHSPSPVRSQVVSPFAATIKRTASAVDISQDFAPGSSLRLPRLKDFSRRSVQKPSQETSHCQNEPTLYPDYLNPFALNELSDPDSANLNCDVSHVSSKLQTKKLFDCTASQVRPGDDHHRVSLEICDSTTFPTILKQSPSNSSASCTTHIRSRSRKKPAPPTPVVVHEWQKNLQPTHSGDSPRRDSSHSSLGTNLQLLSLPKDRSSSACLLPGVCLELRHGNQETKSLIYKRQAPPLPVYGKRTIKADPTDNHVDYAELHEKLYGSNKRINELELEAYKIQQDIQRAIKTNGNVNGLFDKWQKTVEIKNSMAEAHTVLLERLRRQELEERQANLEYELRLLMAKQDMLKTQEEKEREQQLLRDLLKTVNERAELVTRSEETPDGNSVSVSRTKDRKFHKFMSLSAIKLKKKPQEGQHTGKKRFHLFPYKHKLKTLSSTRLVPIEPSVH
ncbi:hypothetical protein P879_00471 [Paragonimus westermani]|uniref:BMERB domain-containing protein n=1 Tax=Paragonimus westermani TaxID=34504 RepID=A0A8T0DQT9_9TREM|nr:hypothetical protein P879_00471 [Paragonimus westermani]